MCEVKDDKTGSMGLKTIPVAESVGMVLAHDITEIRQGEFKGRAFKKGHVVREDDIGHLKRLGKDRLYVLSISGDEMHEDDAAYALATALMGEGVAMEGEPKEGKINIIAERDGLLRIDRDALFEFNMLGDIMCATLHSNTLVRKGQTVAGTRAIPLVVKRELVERAVEIAVKVNGSRVQGFKGSGEGLKSSLDTGSPTGVIEVKELKKPKAGVVITGNEVYYGRIKDAFAQIIKSKIEAFGSEIVGMYYAPDDASFIEGRLRELIRAGADLLITTGGMSVDPDDVTRFAIRNLGVSEMYYGSAVLPGAMFLVAYLNRMQYTEYRIQDTHASCIMNRESFIPILGIPACGMYHKTTVFDLLLPRVLAGEHIGRREIASMGHGGLCLNCSECRYPICPFGK